VNCLGQHSTARRRRRTDRPPWLGLIGSGAALALSFAGLALGPTHRAFADQLSTARAEADQITAQIQAQGQQLAVVSERYDEDQIRVQQLDGQLAQTQDEIAQTKTQVGAAERQLRQLAIQDYMSGGAGNDLEALFAPNGESSVAAGEYEQVASGNVSGAIDRLDASESTLSAQQSQLQSTEAQARATLAAAQIAKQGAQNALSHQQATLAGLKGQIANLVAQQQAAEARAQQAAFAARVSAQQPSSGSGLQPAPPAAGGGGAIAVAAAESQIGVPYIWAGSTPGVGFDCSGLTMWAWGRAGVALSHSAAAQYDETVHVPLSDLQPGDLLFYDEGGTIGHVTMYVGPGEMVQAMETGTNIQITGIWTSGLVGAGRP
jgi:peptidoglycan DL-endopeptidase CwlO